MTIHSLPLSFEQFEAACLQALAAAGLVPTEDGVTVKLNMRTLNREWSVCLVRTHDSTVRRPAVELQFEWNAQHTYLQLEEYESDREGDDQRPPPAQTAEWVTLDAQLVGLDLPFELGEPSELGAWRNQLLSAVADDFPLLEPAGFEDEEPAPELSDRHFCRGLVLRRYVATRGSQWVNTPSELKLLVTELVDLPLVTEQRALAADGVRQRLAHFAGRLRRCLDIFDKMAGDAAYDPEDDPDDDWDDDPADD